MYVRVYRYQAKRKKQLKKYVLVTSSFDDSVDGIIKFIICLSHKRNYTKPSSKEIKNLKMYQRALIVVLLCLEVLTSVSFSCNNKRRYNQQGFQSTSFGLKARDEYLHSSTLFYKNFRADDGDDAQLLPLNDSDIRKIQEMKERHITIPIIILDAILPGQSMNFRR